MNPYKGSEDGMGWNFVLQIARFHKVIAITRQNNKKIIEKYMAEQPNDLYENIAFLYFDLPYWMRFWKKGEKGAMIYYLLWQYGLVAYIKKQNLVFDIAHNVNFHNNWSPSFLWKLGKPFIWGPVGHHPLIPKQYLKPYAIKYWVKDRLTWLVKQYFWRLSYHLMRTKKKATHILCMNTAAANVLRLENNYSIMPSVATQDFGWAASVSENQRFTFISAGRFVPLKGFDLTIAAFARMVNKLASEDKQRCQLLLIGKGPEQVLLQKLAKKHQVEDQVQFIAWLERDELMQIFKNASAFIFPSHEGAGMVVAEAMSFGLPIVCLKNEGPGEFVNERCSLAISPSPYEQTIEQLSEALKTLYANPEKQNALGVAARKRFETHFHWDRRGEQLQKIYAEI